MFSGPACGASSAHPHSNLLPTQRYCGGTPWCRITFIAYQKIGQLDTTPTPCTTNSASRNLNRYPAPGCSPAPLIPAATRRQYLQVANRSLTLHAQIKHPDTAISASVKLITKKITKNTGQQITATTGGNTANPHPKNGLAPAGGTTTRAGK